MNNTVPTIGQTVNKPTIKDTTPLLCPCGSDVFQEAFFLRRLSRLLTGEPRDQIITLPVFICSLCKKPLEEILPEELKKV